MNANDWEDELDRRLRAIDDKLEKLPDGRSRGASAPVEAWDRAAAATGASGGDHRRLVDFCAEPSEAFFRLEPAELSQVYAYVIHAPHVTSNMQYANTAAKTVFNVDPDEAAINAYATHGDEADQPEIRLMGGAVAFARLCGALRAHTSRRNWNGLNGVWPVVGRTVLEEEGCLSPKSGMRILTAMAGSHALDDEGIQRCATAHAAGMMAGIIAHELGHLALGHTLGQAANLEVSRNQEREADSFASSVISTSVFSDPMVEGMMLWELAWTWCEKAQGGTDATTHPLAEERLRDFIRANHAVAAGLGISLDNLTDLLPV